MISKNLFHYILNIDLAFHFKILILVQNWLNGYFQKLFVKETSLQEDPIEVKTFAPRFV